MLPLYGLYELSIFLSARTQKKYHPENVTTAVATTSGSDVAER